MSKAVEHVFSDCMTQLMRNDLSARLRHNQPYHEGALKFAETSEVYTALQRGTIDAQTQSSSNILRGKRFKKAVYESAPWQ